MQERCKYFQSRVLSPYREEFTYPSLFRNLASIENFRKKKLRRNGLKKMMSHSKDMADIARYREILKQSLNIYGVSVPSTRPRCSTFFRSKATSQSRNIYSSSWSNYNGSERRWGQRDGGLGREEQASQAEIHRIQEEDRARHAEQAHEKRRRVHMIAKLKKSQADVLRLIQAENARLEFEQQAFRGQRMGRTPSPLPQNYLAPTPPIPIPPMNPYICHSTARVYPALPCGSNSVQPSVAHLSMLKVSDFADA